MDEEWSTPQGTVRQQSERITNRGETVFIMRASAGHATLRARSSVVSDRLNDIAKEVRALRGRPETRRVAIDRSGESTVIRFGQHELVHVYGEDAELESLVAQRPISHAALTEEWRDRLQSAIDSLSTAPVTGRQK